MDKKSSSLRKATFKPQTLVELLRWRAETQPNTRAYTYLKDGEKKEIHLTYGELDKRARAIAVSLQKKGLAGERALLLYPPGLDYISGFFGCLYAGVIAVPAYPPDPNRLNRSLPRLQAIVNDARATLALTTDSIYYMIKMLQLGNKFSSSLDKLPVLRKFRTSMKYFAGSKGAVAKSKELGDLDWMSTDSIAIGMADDWTIPKIEAETTAFLQYTSGSTGTPKGVILTHTNLIQNSEIIKNATAFSENAEGVFWLPIYHDMGLIGGILQPLYAPIPSTLMSPLAFLQRPLRWLEIISRLKDRQVGSAAPNFAYELCIKKATPEKVKELDLSNWVYALSGAEPVRHQTIERFSEVFKAAGFKKSAFYPAYGLAEATLLVTASDFHKPPIYITVDKLALKKNKIIELPLPDINGQTLVSSGKNQPDQQTIIVDPEKHSRCGDGQIGEIWVKGPSVSKGYYGRPQETKETFQNYLAGSGEGPFLRTGDLGFIKDQEVYITGRVKDLIIIRGTNHYPQDIEMTVEQCHPEIRHGCSAAFTIDINDQEQLVVVIEVRHSKNVDFDEIISSVRQAISENHDLQVYAVVLIKARSINKTSSGKIQRKATKIEYLEDQLSILAKWEATKDTLSFVPVGQSVEESRGPSELESVAVEVLTKDKLTVGIEEWLVSHLAELLNVEASKIDIRQPFISFGLDSAQAVGLAGDLEEWLERELSPTLIWDYPTIEALARHLASEEVELLPVFKTKQKRLSGYEPIAVIGMGAKFPGANNYKEFWIMLKNGLDGISEVPPDRWNAEEFYDPEPGSPGKMITKNGGFIDNVDLFDAEFFGIAPREAAQMDPQQRLLLEVSWDALEHAGQTSEGISGSRTGVFIGISTSDYVRLQKGGYTAINPYSGTGNALSIAANRISYLFDLRGPSLAIDTACSSSLVAVHNACQSLRDGDCDMALAGGVNLILSPELTITFSQAHMMSADGKCKTFDASADGYGRGEGAAIIVLKRLSDALQNNDRILAVIQGSAMNQDGRSNGITAPNGLAQQAVMSEALDNAGLTPDQIKYLETHGTGTALGDPIEIESIKKTMLQERSKDNTLFIGSVKTNIGHLESAAGIAGLIKVILSLVNEEIPPHLHFKNWNPHVKIDQAPIEVNTKNLPWKRGDKTRYAGISAFGFGGTNTHMILCEAPEQNLSPEEITEKRAQLLILSAHNRNALKDKALRYSELMVESLKDTPQQLYDLVYSESLFRSKHDHRLVLVGDSLADFRAQLQGFIDDPASKLVIQGKVDPGFNPKIAFVYSGQGPQWWAMGRELMAQEPIFRATIERISFLLEEYTSWSLMEELKKNEQSSRLDETEVAQPALFAIQVALTALWRSWGILPQAVVGHSVGEVAAAHVAGILSLENAVEVIYHRSRLMQKATGLGQMAAVDLPVDELHTLIADQTGKISIGAHNSITSNVISGKEEALDLILKRLADKDIFHKKLPVNYAFHSPQMEPYQNELKNALADLKLQNMKIKIISTVRGSVAEPGDYGAEYWSRNIRECVRFSEAIDQLLEEKTNLFIEIGPHPVLRNYIDQNGKAHKKTIQIMTSLRRKEPERAQMLKTLGSLFISGYPVDWKKIFSTKGNFIDLPFYPFQRERYWLEDQKYIPAAIERQSGPEVTFHPLLGEQQRNALFPNNSTWNVVLRSDYVAYLNRGRQSKIPILPESAYLEMAVAASRQIFSKESTLLRNIVFKNNLKLRKNETRQLHFILTPLSASRANFQATSQTRNREGDVQWIMHSLGSIINDQNEEEQLKAFSSLAELKTKLIRQSAAHQYFARSNASDIISDKLYETAEEIWTAPREALLKLNLRKVKVNDFNVYHIHPIVLDTCFRLITATISEENQIPFSLVPHSLDYLKLYGHPSEELWVYVKIDEINKNNKIISCQLHLIDNNGNLILDIQGLRLKPHPAQFSIADFVYEIDWQEVDFNKTRRRTADLSEHWLILADAMGIAEQLAQKLKQRGKKCLLARLAESNITVAHDEFNFNPLNPDDCRNLLNRILPDRYNLVYVLSLDEKITNSNDHLKIWHLFKTIDKKPKEFWFLTQNVLPISRPDKTPFKHQVHLLDEFHEFLWTNEDWRCHHIDIDENEANLLNGLYLPLNESQIAIRDGKLFVPRLIHSSEIEDKEGQPEVEDLSKVIQERRSPSAGKLEIEVMAASLGMRDVQRINHYGIEMTEELGLSCAGIVTSVHPSVKEFKPGDQVIALSKGALSKYVLVNEEFVQHKPVHLDFEAAATIPVNFITAYYALQYLARIQQGESILILDAASNDGLAALQIAQANKAEIFVTTDSAEKRLYLKNKGVRYVFDENKLDYIDEILRLTNNKGVDIILNTSSKDSSSASFVLIKEFGRYLDLNMDTPLDQPIIYQHLRRNISYFSIDFEQIIDQQVPLAEELFDQVIDTFNKLKWQALQTNTFSKNDLSAALQQLRENRKIGKYIISYAEKQPEISQADVLFRPEQTFLIAGVFNQNELGLLDWMINHGACHFYVLGLNKYLPENEIRSRNRHQVTIKEIQITNLNSITALDGIFLSSSSIPPKDREETHGYMELLANLAKDKKVKFFISTSVFDLLPQQSFNKERVFIENTINRINQELNKQGIPALQIRLAGTIPDSSQHAMTRWNILKYFIDIEAGDYYITDVNWTALEDEFNLAEFPALYSDLLPVLDEETEEATRETMPVFNREDILSEEPEARGKYLEAYLKTEMAKVLKIPVKKIDSKQSLITLGIDSLMAIELKNTVENRLGITIPIATLLQGPSIEMLTDEILPQLTASVPEPEQPKIKVHPTTKVVEADLSQGQKAMYFQHLMAPESIFNLAYAVRIRSAFDKSKLKEAFQVLVDRHPSMRTTFHLRDGKPIQRIHPEMEAFFKEEDIENWAEDKIRNRLDDEVLRHFDLAHGPLLRVFLFKKADNDYILLFVMHHIVTDIWSQALILNELSLIFSDPKNTSVLLPLANDYSDYIRWQEELLSSKEGEHLLSYWKNKLSGELPILNFPVDHPRPSVQTYQGKTETIWFGEELSQEIKFFNEKHGITTFMTLLAAYYILLHRYSGQKDLIVGSPTAGRSKKEFANVIGYFINPIPFRIILENNPHLNDFIAQVKAMVLEAFDHMDYPLTMMVEKIHPQRDPSRTPLFQTMFILQRAHLMHDQGLSKFALSREGASLNLGGLTIESMNLEQGVAPFELTMMTVESGTGLAASLGYNIDLFRTTTIQRILQHYVNILKEIVSEKNPRLSEIQLLSKDELIQLTKNWNDTFKELPMDCCVHQIFEKQVLLNPDKSAVIFQNEQLSYDQLNRKANQLARFLRKNGVKQEDMVGICLERSLEMVIAMLGVIKAGAAYVPIDPSYPPERIRFMFMDSNLSIILTQKHLLNKLESNKARLFYLDNGRETVWAEEDSNLDCRILPENLVYIIYTSGSTGKPKGTMLHHRGLINALSSTTKNYYVRQDSKILQFASFSFDASVEEIFGALISGATIHLLKKETLLSLGELIQFIREHQLTNMTLPPSVLGVLQPEDFPSLRTVISAGEKCTPSIANRWSKGRHFINGYGPTEATICTTTFEIKNEIDNAHVSIGKPVNNTRIYILDEDLHPTPLGVPGELYIGGYGLARGYFNRPDLTAERFVPDPFSESGGERLYKTGDLVRYLEDGNIEFIDRIDEQVKIRGYRIELGEIETLIKMFTAVRTTTVLARSSAAGDKQIVAYVVPQQKPAFDIDLLMKHLRAHLPDYMIPAAVVILEELPLTSNGKVDRKALPDPELKSSAHKLVKPANEIEKKLSLIWQEVLNVEQVGVNDSFFDLGGHSLRVVQVQGKIKEIFDREISVVDMFKYPTIRSLAKFFEDETTTKESIKKSQERANRQKEATKIQQQRLKDRRK